MTWNYIPITPTPEELDDGVYLAETYKHEEAIFIIAGTNYWGWYVMSKLPLNPADIEKWMAWPEEKK